jgi:hypothetical protein
MVKTGFLGCGTLESNACKKHFEGTCCLGRQGESGNNGEVGSFKFVYRYYNS